MGRQKYWRPPTTFAFSPSQSPPNSYRAPWKVSHLRYWSCPPIFCPCFSKIEAVLKRSQTALLVLAEENDHAAYVSWLRARGVVRRSMDGPVLAEAIRRVARGELFIQGRTSDMRINPSEVA